MTLTRNLIIIISALVLAGCSFQRELFQSAELNSMLEHSQPFTELETGYVVRNDYQDFHKSLGKPIPAEVRIEIEPRGSYTEQDVYEEIIGIFERNNWEKEELSVDDPGFYRASLSQNGFLIRSSVLIQTDSNIVSILFQTISQRTAANAPSNNTSEL